MKRIKILSLFFITALLFTSVNISAANINSDSDTYVPVQTSQNNISPFAVIQYPLLDFELSENWYPAESSITLSLICTPKNALNSDNTDFTWSVSNSAYSVTSAGVLTTPSTLNYTNLTITHKSTGVAKTYTIRSGVIPEGYYRIKNKATGRYMDVEGVSKASNAKIQQADHNGSTQ